MISKHCNVSLKRVWPKLRQKCVWICPKCGKMFAQKKRQSQKNKDARQLLLGIVGKLMP